MNFLLVPVLRMIPRTPSSSQRIIVSGFESWGTSGYALSPRLRGNALLASKGLL